MKGNVRNCSCENESNHQNSLRLESEDENFKRIYLEESRFNKTISNSCYVNYAHVYRLSEKFVDVEEKKFHINSRSILNIINIHNNKIGRLAVRDKLITDCSMSQLGKRICRHRLPMFNDITKYLRFKYDHSTQISRLSYKTLIPVNHSDNSNSPNSENDVVDLTKTLVYTKNPIDYCARDIKNGIRGVKDRECRVNELAKGSCQNLCCDRGYNLKIIHEIVNCNCSIIFCCKRICSKCKVDRKFYTCK